tara:strand:- start:2041 stop:4113 length:2073 start_codon:yes stop_codon:yes gene_type:complete
MVITKSYDSKKIEKRIYRFWMKSGFFNPDKLPKTHKKTYTIVLPPPNITGTLHMGHALNTVIQDTLIRQKRMQGFKTLWLPGTDHAGIAAQNVVEKELKKEGLTRFDLGREKFTKRMWAWKKKYGSIILDQLKEMGASCDWSRNRFTMDKEYSKAVKTAFLHYYKKGLIYRDKKVINWCLRCQTSLSDLELEYREKKGYLWFIKYPFVNSKDKYITVATTRPETMLGDMAVAVNPKDKRYKNLVGKKVILPLTSRKIPIISSPLIDKEFGTGAVKITPAHDLKDSQIGRANNLGYIQIIDEKGRINKKAPLPYQGLSVIEARNKVIEDLKEAGLLEKTEDYTHQIPKCYRCNATIELIPSLQWFLRMRSLTPLAVKSVKSNKTKFVPKRWEKVYFDWLKNIRDWCISRQLWWGHKIPIKGENDVLDTWFSSALWPFATLGWPEKTKDLSRFYPTDVLGTDRGIINLWVTRMIFSGMEFMKKAPFQYAYIHATVLTKEGKRMSKSLGTGINPIDLIEKYGADSTRFGIAWLVTELQDIKFVEDNIVMGKKFCNKIWNASRFVLLQIKDEKQTINYKFKTKNLTASDKKILKELKKTIKSVNNNLEKFLFGKAAQTLYKFFWHSFCDKYLEESKKQIQDQKLKTQTKQILLYVLLTSIKLLHPFIPFITEEIYQKLPLKSRKKSLMIEEWPK